MQPPHFGFTINFFLSREIADSLNRAVEKFKPLFSDHDYLPERYYHCTVKNLGILPPHLNPRAFIHYRPLLRSIVTSHPAFEVEMVGLDYFPTALIARIYSPNGELEHIHRELFNLLPDSDPRYEGKNYTPHATLAFFRESPVRLISWMREQGYGNLFFGRMKVQKMELMNWDTGDSKANDLIENYYLRTAGHAE